MKKFLKYGVGVLILLGLLAAVGLFVVQQQRQIKQKEQQIEITKTRQVAEKNSVLGKAKEALGNSLNSADGLDTSYDGATKTLTIIEEEDPAQGLDQSQQLFSLTPDLLVQRAFSFFINCGRVVFGVDGIDKIVLIQKVPLDTGEGTVVVTDVVKLSADKDKFLSVDWSQLTGKPVYKQLKEVTSIFYVEQRVAKSIKNVNALVLTRS